MPTTTTRRLAAALGAAAMLLPAAVSADPAYLITDLSGDANGVNSQGFGDLIAPASVPDTATPADLAMYDIRGIRYATVFEDVGTPEAPVFEAVGLEARMALGAQPTPTSPPAIIRLVQEANGCSMFLQHYGGTNGVNASGAGTIRITCEGDLTGGNPPTQPATTTWDAETSELVWTHTFGSNPVVDRYIKDGALITPTNPHVRGNTGAATVPVIDEVYNPNLKSFRIGSDAPTAG